MVGANNPSTDLKHCVICDRNKADDKQRQKCQNGHEYFELYYAYNLQTSYIPELKLRIDDINNNTSEENEKLQTELEKCHEIVTEYEQGRSIKVDELRWTYKDDLSEEYDCSHIKGTTSRCNRREFGNVGTVFTLQEITRLLSGGMLLISSTQKTTEGGLGRVGDDLYIV